MNHIFEDISSSECLFELFKKNRFLLDIGENSSQVAESQTEEMQQKICFALTTNRMAKKLLRPVTLNFWPFVLKEAMRVFRIDPNELKIRTVDGSATIPTEWDGIATQEDAIFLLLRQKALTEIPVFIRGVPERPTQAPVYRTRTGRAVKPAWKVKEARGI